MIQLLLKSWPKPFHVEEASTVYTASVWASNIPTLGCNGWAWGKVAVLLFSPNYIPPNAN